MSPPNDIRLDYRRSQHASMLQNQTHQMDPHSHTQQMQSDLEQSQQQQSPSQLPHRPFHNSKQQSIVVLRYCSDPACCANHRYQPYSPSTPTTAAATTTINKTTPSLPHRPHHQQPIPSPIPVILQKQLQHFHSSKHESPSRGPHNLYNRNTIIYRKPGLVRLRPKDASTQTDPIECATNSDRVSLKKKLQFSNKFIEHISSLVGNPANKITSEAANCR